MKEGAKEGKSAERKTDKQRKCRMREIKEKGRK